MPERPTEVLQQRLSPTCMVRVTFWGVPTQEAVSRLIAHLSLLKESLPEEEPEP
jgi:hypothetical protein